MNNIRRLAEMAQDADDEAAAANIPVIRIKGGERHIAADAGIAALMVAKVPFYQRNRKIQRIALVQAKNTSGEVIMVPGIVTVDAAMMARELGRSAIWQRHDLKQKKVIRIDPPEKVCSQILSMVGQWPFAPLNGIVQCPTLRRDGSLLDREGYDEATGLVLVGNIPMPAIPARPARQDAERALALLIELLGEFPFIDKESQAVALSMVITPVVRGAMSVAPMHLVTAPLAGSGKSYLADVASMIATGEVCAVKSAARVMRRLKNA
jgi:putative DNA primase/helicase